MNHDSSPSTSTSDSSSSDDEVDEVQTEVQTEVKIREKRSLLWCGVRENHTSAVFRPRVTWPPTQASRSNGSWKRLRHVDFGNPMFGTKMQLWAKTGHHLSVYPDGTVRGTPDENDLHTYLELISAGHTGHVRIKGLLSNLYVGMDRKGRLYGEPDMMDDSTVFIEAFQGSYSTFLSRKYAHLGWYIGIKKNGKFKRGPKTAYGQKAIRFLPRRSKFQ